MKDLYILRRYYLKQVSERFLLWFVWKLPKTLILWSSVRMIAHATTGEYDTTVVPEITAMDALGRWNESKTA